MKKIFLFALATLFQTAVAQENVVPFDLVKPGAKALYKATQGEKRKSVMGFTYVQREVTSAKDLGEGKMEVITRATYLNKKMKPAKLIGKKEGSYVKQTYDNGAYTNSNLTFGQAYSSVRYEGFVYKMPANLAVGDSLETGTSTWYMKFMGRNIKTVYAYKNFVVTGEEDLQTPAGTFHCFVLNGQADGTDGNGKSFYDKETIWIARGVGFVKFRQEVDGVVYYFELDKLENN